MNQPRPGTCVLCIERPVAALQLQAGVVRFPLCVACDQSEVGKRVHDALDGYDIKQGVICSPGKFEGEHAYVPYFWTIYLDGGADDDGQVITIPVEPGDRRLFPALRRRRYVRLGEDDFGFVSEVTR